MDPVGFPGWPSPPDIGDMVRKALKPFTEKFEGMIENVKGMIENVKGVLEQQIWKLEQQIGKFEQQIGNLEGQIGNLEGQIGSLKEKIADQVENFKQNIEKEIESVTKHLESLEKEIEKWKNFLDPTKILDKGIEVIPLVPPDDWSVKIGVVSVSFRGFNKPEAVKLLGYATKLFPVPPIYDADALKPFIVPATRVDINIEGTIPGTSIGGGISWGYDEPGEKVDKIIQLIKKLTSDMPI